MIRTFALAVALAASAPFAQAQTLAPVHAKTVDLGNTQGSAFYVPEAKGFHLVATLYADGAASPIRFNAVLSDGQSASVSVPGPTGTLAHEVVFSASGGRMVVHDSAAPDSGATMPATQ